MEIVLKNCKEPSWCPCYTWDVNDVRYPFSCNLPTNDFAKSTEAELFEKCPLKHGPLVIRLAEKGKNE